MTSALDLAPPPPSYTQEHLVRRALRLRHGALGFFDEVARSTGDLVEVDVGIHRFYVLNEPQGIRRVLLTNADNYSRAQNLSAPYLRPFLGDSILTTDGEIWRRARQLGQPAFRPAGLADARPRVRAAARRFFDTLAQRVGNAPVDLFPTLMALTISTTLASLFGHEVDWETARRGADAMLDAQDAMFARIRRVVPLPNAAPTPANRRFHRATTVLEEIVQIALAQRRGDGSGRPPDYLQALLDWRHPATGEGLTPNELRDHVVTMFVAAPENTAITMTWAVYLLARHPEAARRVLADVAASAGHDERHTPVMQGLIDEVLRLYPGAPYFDRKVLEDDVLCGHRVRAGGIVMIVPYTLHRHPEYWDHPERFDIDRFVGGGPNAQGAYIPFGLGPRRCIGDRFAMMLLRTVLPELLERFEFVPVDASEVVPDARINLRPKGGMAMGIRVRSA